MGGASVRGDEQLRHDEPPAGERRIGRPRGLAAGIVAAFVVVAAAAIPAAAANAQAGTTERVSVSSAGGEGDAASLRPSISADGRYVAFHSDAASLVPGDSNGVQDVFVHDRESATTERVSIAFDGGEGDADSTADLGAG
jgi:hypothetical protein